MKKVILIIGILVGVGIVIGSFFRETPDTALSMMDYTGTQRTIDEFVGKPHIINVWATWCPFCVDELPDFAVLQSEYPEVQVIAINRGESIAKAKDFTDSMGISEEMTFLVNEEDDYYSFIGGFAMPETLFISSSGETVIHKRGFMEIEEMRQRAEQLLLNEQGNL